MISLYQLKNKLNKQAKDFALALNISDLYAQGLWTAGVYNCNNFSQVHEHLDSMFDFNSLESILHHDSFKYLMINEYDDNEIIDSLHKEIASMAARIEGLMLKEVDTLLLVSIIYKVLGLHDDSRFIVNTGAEFRLEWHPYYRSSNDPNQVQYADLTILGYCYRLVATKYPYNNLSLSNIKKYMYLLHSEHQDLFETNAEEHNNFLKHAGWFVKTFEQTYAEHCNDSCFTPTVFKIKGIRYIVYGFRLNSALITKQNKSDLDLRIKNIDGDQKFVVRIDQQEIMFYARRFTKRILNTVEYDKYIAEPQKGVLSHVDADERPVVVEGNKFVTFFFPILP